MNVDWRDDDIDLLKRLWADGETAASIAEKLGGLSRSAVLGKIFRLRLGPNASKGQAWGGDESEPAPATGTAPRRRRRRRPPRVATAKRCSI